MNITKSTPRLVRLSFVVISLILVLLPFHAFLTVWGASLLGHYTLLRLWKEGLLLLLVLAAAVVLYRDRPLQQQLQASWLVRAIAAFLGVLSIWAIGAYLLGTVDLKAVVYGLLIDSRFLFFFLAVWILSAHHQRLHRQWPKLLVIPALVVILIGLLQYFVLPYDVLKHFGYSQATIYPYETINHNLHHLRIMSTLRGANPLGAYLLLIICLLIALWHRHRRWWLAALAAIASLTLVLTFSRSAWLGLILSLLVFGGVWLHTRRAKRLASVLGVVGLLLIGGLFITLRHSTSLQDALYHTDDHSTVAMSSNQGHSSALKSGLKDMLHQPLGRGPGSAGPASVYNNHPSRIAENFFVQIGQETGWLGFGLFIAINGLLGRELWRQSTDPLALGLFAALIGLSFVNLLSHAWADDTLAYLFWGLAAIAITRRTGTS